MCNGTTEKLNQSNWSDEVKRMTEESSAAIQLLEHCESTPGAKISITIAHNDGQTVTANLFDHAALVQVLIEALSDFKSEL